MNHQINIRLNLQLNPDFKPKQVAEMKINQLTALASGSFKHINLLSAMFENGELTQFDFLDAVNILSQLGGGVVNAIETVAGEELFTEAKSEAPLTRKDTENYTGNREIDNLALAISSLLNNPDLPPPIYSGISDTLTDFFNTQVDQNDFSDDTTSGEYIARLLASYKKKVN